MKVTIPEELKRDAPPTTFGKIFAATPVVMAVIATMLAGLASSEMTRAQYDRSLGAQQQSKAGDQWSFFQAKRLRGAYQRNTAELLQVVTEVRELDPGSLRSAVAQLTEPPSTPAATPDLKEAILGLVDSPAGQRALTFLQRGELPPAGPEAPIDPQLKAALDGAESLKTDSEMAALLSVVSNSSIEDAVRTGRDKAQAFDEATKPMNQSVDQLDALLTRQTAVLRSAADKSASLTAIESARRDFAAARLRYLAQRYEVEARLNQAIANLYELQVRKSNISAERHHLRSQRFFFGMLGAQLAVIISTFAMAARQRNLLWSLAAVAGVLAVVFAIYVYLRF